MTEPRLKFQSEDETPGLPEILDEIWRQLGAGVADRRHGFHLPVVASVRSDGAAAARTVVLRGADRGARTLWFHTDARSAKLGELAAEPRLALVLYDAAERTQVRADVVAAIHRGDAHAEAAWGHTRIGSRRCYLQHGAPGLPRDQAGSGLQPHLAQGRLDPAESEAGRVNFAVVRCRVRRFDWLYLTARGNRRARFDWDSADGLSATWLLP